MLAVAVKLWWQAHDSLSSLPYLPHSLLSNDEPETCEALFSSYVGCGIKGAITMPSSDCVISNSSWTCSHISTLPIQLQFWTLLPMWLSLKLIKVSASLIFFCSISQICAILVFTAAQKLYRNVSYPEDFSRETGWKSCLNQLGRRVHVHIFSLQGYKWSVPLLFCSLRI